MRVLGLLSISTVIIGLFPSTSAWAGVNDAEFLMNAEGLATFDTAAGTPMEDLNSPAPIKSYSANLIRKIQQGLADQGFFLGAIDGRFGPKTASAIRAYQKSADLFIDGIPTPQLSLDLETGGKVGVLLKRLKKSRDRATKSARESLLSRPETRNLIQGTNDLAKAPRNAKLCMENPEPRCLLLEASISAGNIEKSEMRDWALGEILTSQAKAGLAVDALSTTRRIHDPRLIMVALRDIAKAQVSSGDSESALAAVDIIPDLEQQVEAYVAIAEIQANLGQIDAAAKTSSHLIQYVRRIKSPLTKITFRTRVAVIVYKAGFKKLALQHIQSANDLIRSIRSNKDRDEGMRYIAGAYAETGNPKKAMDVLKHVKNGADDVPVLIAAATGLAQAGSSDEALITAESIEAVRYRALVLARIAAYQAGAGDIKSARKTLDKSLAAAKTIRFPFAKAYAFSRIALALNDVSISNGEDQKMLEESLNTTALIKDERLKAHIFWTIADQRRNTTDISGSELAKQKALSATDDIKSPFSRVWMLCDIAEERAQRKEIDSAWSLFNEALLEAKSISHPWGRARALSKVASTMTILADHSGKIPARP